MKRYKKQFDEALLDKGKIENMLMEYLAIEDQEGIHISSERLTNVGYALRNVLPMVLHNKDFKQSSNVIAYIMKKRNPSFDADYSGTKLYK